MKAAPGSIPGPEAPPPLPKPPPPPLPIDEDDPDEQVPVELPGKPGPPERAAD